MSHALTPTATPLSSTTVTVPDGGDARTASSVVTPIQALLNVISWLDQLINGVISKDVIIKGNIDTSLGGTAGPGDIHGSRDITANRDVHVAGVITGRRVANDFLGPDANTTYVLKSTECVVATGLTAPRAYTIDVTDAIAGMRIAFSTRNSANVLTLVGPFDGSPTWVLQSTSGSEPMAEFTYLGGVLYPISRFKI